MPRVLVKNRIHLLEMKNTKSEKTHENRLFYSWHLRNFLIFLPFSKCITKCIFKIIFNILPDIFNCTTLGGGFYDHLVSHVAENGTLKAWYKILEVVYLILRQHNFVSSKPLEFFILLCLVLEI